MKRVEIYFYIEVIKVNVYTRDEKNAEKKRVFLRVIPLVLTRFSALKASRV
jgi:hypothetical protein